MAKKLTRKELLKEPDEFISTSATIIEFIQTNPRTVAIGIAVVLLCVFTAAGVYGWRQYRQSKSHELYGKAYREYQAAVSSKTPVSDEQWDKLFKQFDLLAEKYGSFVEGEAALLYSGHVLYAKKDFKGALERYKKMKSTRLVEQGLGSLVLYHMAMTCLAMNDYDQAMLFFDQLSKDTKSPYQRQALSSIADIYEALGKNKEAVQAYRQYLKMFPQAPDAPYVKARIADLASQG